MQGAAEGKVAFKIPENLFIKLELEWVYWVYRLNREPILNYDYYIESWRVRPDGMTVPDPHSVFVPDACGIWAAEYNTLSYEIVTGVPDDINMILWLKESKKYRSNGQLDYSRSDDGSDRPEYESEGYSPAAAPTKCSRVYYIYHCQELLLGLQPQEPPPGPSPPPPTFDPGGTSTPRKPASRSIASGTPREDRMNAIDGVSHGGKGGER